MLDINQIFIINIFASIQSTAMKIQTFFLSLVAIRLLLLALLFTTGVPSLAYRIQTLCELRQDRQRVWQTQHIESPFRIAHNRERKSLEKDQWEIYIQNKLYYKIPERNLFSMRKNKTTRKKDVEDSTAWQIETSFYTWLFSFAHFFFSCFQIVSGNHIQIKWIK